MFYAALELRCAVEARQNHYLETQEKYRREMPKAWKLKDQGRELQRVYKGELIQHLIIEMDGRPSSSLYHVPVSNRLRQFVSLLDEYRHAQTKFRATDDKWWTTFSDKLLATYRLTWSTLQGNIMSPALLSKSDKDGRQYIEMIHEIDHPPADLDDFKGKVANIRVAYLAAPPPEWICDL